MRNVYIASITVILAAAILAGPCWADSASSSVVRRFSDESTVEGGSSVLVRTQDRASANFLTTATPGDAYTIWWVVFNKPQNCSAPACDDDDVLPPPGNVAAEVSVLYGTGRVADANGKAKFGAELKVGDMTNVLFGPGLLDVDNAEIHLVARTHGPASPDVLQEQISSFNGGCPPGECVDEQFAIHQAHTDQTAMTLQQIQALLGRVARRLSIEP